MGRIQSEKDVTLRYGLTKCQASKKRGAAFASVSRVSRPRETLRDRRGTTTRPCTEAHQLIEFARKSQECSKFWQSQKRPRLSEIRKIVVFFRRSRNSDQTLELVGGGLGRFVKSVSCARSSCFQSKPDHIKKQSKTFSFFSDLELFL